jgi:hypothetical protein
MFPYQAYTFKGKRRRAKRHPMSRAHKVVSAQSYVPDQEWEVLRVEQLNFRDAALRDKPKFTTKDVDETSKNEYICDKRRGAKLRQISDKRHGEEYDELHDDEILDWDERHAARSSIDKALQVLRDEYRICGDKADL